MKSKTTIITLGTVIAVLICLSFRSTGSNPETIMIRSTQINMAGKNNSFIKIYKGKEQVERIQIDKWDWEADDKNYDKILNTVKTYEEQGYQIISHSATTPPYGLVDTFILTKK